MRAGWFCLDASAAAHTRVHARTHAHSICFGLYSRLSCAPLHTLAPKMGMVSTFVCQPSLLIIVTEFWCKTMTPFGVTSPSARARIVRGPPGRVEPRLWRVACPCHGGALHARLLVSRLHAGITGITLNGFVRWPVIARQAAHVRHHGCRCLTEEKPN